MIPHVILSIENDDDREFMTHLFLEYQRLMYREIFQITHDAWATDDILQETLVKLIDKIPLLRSRDRDRRINYIISASKNTAFNHLRKQKKLTIFSFEDEMDSPLDLSDDPIELFLDHLGSEEDLDRLHKVWPQLDEKTRYLLESRYILKNTPEEIAKDLGIKVSSLRMALTRAKRKAKKLMAEETADIG